MNLRLLICQGCGGEAHYRKKRVEFPLCHACKKAAKASQDRKRNPAKGRLVIKRVRPTTPERDFLPLRELEPKPTRELCRIFLGLTRPTSAGTIETIERVRLVLEQREDFVPHGLLLARMKTYGSTVCPCGRPGLFIIGTRTFCRRCKPGSDSGLKWRTTFYEEQSAAVAQEKHEKDSQDLNRKSLFSTSRHPQKPR